MRHASPDGDPRAVGKLTGSIAPRTPRQRPLPDANPGEFTIIFRSGTCLRAGDDMELNTTSACVGNAGKVLYDARAKMSIKRDATCHEQVWCGEKLMLPILTSSHCAKGAFGWQPSDDLTAGWRLCAISRFSFLWGELNTPQQSPSFVRMIRFHALEEMELIKNKICLPTETHRHGARRSAFPTHVTNSVFGGKWPGEGTGCLLVTARKATRGMRRGIERGKSVSIKSGATAVPVDHPSKLGRAMRPPSRRELNAPDGDTSLLRVVDKIRGSECCSMEHGLSSDLSVRSAQGWALTPPAAVANKSKFTDGLQPRSAARWTGSHTHHILWACAFELLSSRLLQRQHTPFTSLPDFEYQRLGGLEHAVGSTSASLPHGPLCPKSRGSTRVNIRLKLGLIGLRSIFCVVEIWTHLDVQRFGGRGRASDLPVDSRVSFVSGIDEHAGAKMRQPDDIHVVTWGSGFIEDLVRLVRTDLAVSSQHARLCAERWSYLECHAQPRISQADSRLQFCRRSRHAGIRSFSGRRGAGNHRVRLAYPSTCSL